MCTSDSIMSILMEKPMNLLSWNVTSCAGGSLKDRHFVLLNVSGFKHRGAVAVISNSLPGYFDIKLFNEKDAVIKSVEFISACKLSEMIDQLVEVTEHYFDDIERWLEKCPSDKVQRQQIGRLAKRCPEIAAKIQCMLVPFKR